MKIAILTYPVHSNFGFLMQAYALQKFLIYMGHEPYTFNIEPTRPRLLNRIKQTIKDIIYTAKGVEGYCAFRYWPTTEQQYYMDTNTWKFVKENIQLTDVVKKITDLYHTDVSKYDAFIVGSDQVWRYAYLDNITSYFFDFIPNDKPRMSYAASFGISHLDYKQRDKEACKQLIRKFDVVTVREYEGVDICRNEFGVEATKVIDPTFLLSKDDYSALAAKGNLPKTDNPFLFAYILDWNGEKRSIIEKLAYERGLEIINLLPQKFHLVGPSKIEELVYPSVYDILRAFRDADYVVTDSFHGTAFSIILNKQFSIFLNKNRGNSRLTSILQTFGLEDRVISGCNVHLPFCQYDNINLIINEQRTKSVDILNNFFNEKK